MIYRPTILERRPLGEGRSANQPRPPLRGWQTMVWSGSRTGLENITVLNKPQSLFSSILKKIGDKLPWLKSARGHSNLDIMLVISGGAATYLAGLTFGLSAPVAGIVGGFLSISYLYAVPATLHFTMIAHAHIRRYLRNKVINPFINKHILPWANAERRTMGKKDLPPIAQIPGEFHWRDLKNNIPLSLYGGLAGVATLGYLFGPPALLALGLASAAHLVICEVINRFRYPGGDNNVLNKFPWVRPELKSTEDDAPQGLFHRAVRYLRDYNHAIYRMERSFTIETLQDLGRLVKWIFTDRARRKTALFITAALVSWGACTWATVGSLYWAANYVYNAGWSLSGMISAVGIFMYILGAMTVRWSTTIGFQNALLQALKRSGEYFRSEQAEKAYVSGFVPVGRSINVPGVSPAENRFVNQMLSEISFGAEKIPSVVMPKMAIIHYVATEPPDLMVRGSWSSFLVENRLAKQKIIHVNMTRGGRDAVLGNQRAADTVRTQIEAWRQQARQTPRTFADVITFLRQLRDDYARIGQAYLDTAREKFQNREQGEGEALDERLGLDFMAHAKKWEAKAGALELIDRSTLSTWERANVLEAIFSYLHERFEYDIIVNARVYCYADLNLYYQVGQNLRGKLPAGINLAAPLDEATAKALITAINGELRLTNRVLNQEMYGRTPKDFNEWLAEFQRDCIAKKLTAEHFLSVLLLEGIAQPSWGGGAKAGGQDNWYAKVGSVKVVVETPFITDGLIKKKENAKRQVSTLLELSMADWRQLSAKLLDDSATVSGRPIPDWFPAELLAQLRPAFANIIAALALKPTDVADQATAARIIAEVAQRYLHDRSKQPNREKQRILERLANVAVREKFTVSELLREALYIAINPRQVEWVDWHDYDFILSFDKDYLPTSINEMTGEYDDGIRQIVPHLFRVQAKEGDVNVTVVQGNQFYYNYTQFGPLASPSDPDARPDQAGDSRLYHPVQLEITNNAANIDQKTWYGAVVSRAFRQLDNILRFALTNPTTTPTAKEFLAAACLLVKKALDPGVGRQTISDEMETRQPGLDWNQPLSPNLGHEIVERLKNHVNQQAYATGLLPGRDTFQAVFNCGTCRVENLTNIFSAFTKPYVMGRNGHIIAQVEFAYDPQSQQQVMKRYEPRYPAERGGQRSKESREHQKCRILPLNGRQGQALINQLSNYYQPRRIRVSGNKVLLTLANGERIVTYWYWPGAPEERKSFLPEECRRVEVHYPSAGGKYYRDYDLQSVDNYFEVNPTGRWKRVLLKVTGNRDQVALDNLAAIAQIDRSAVRFFAVPSVGNFLEVPVFIPEITVDYVTPDYRELLGHPNVQMPDKHITEDMESTYKQNERGFVVRHYPNRM